VARGHWVFTPTLTGVGDRAHLLSKDISLQTHVEDILAVTKAEELSDFILVGHSYGGLVISGVADMLREQGIEALVHCFEQPELRFARSYLQPCQERPYRVVQDHRGRARLHGDCS
jgi:pimeloyl-ACP methyl ester carboxylesterase